MNPPGKKKAAEKNKRKPVPKAWRDPARAKHGAKQGRDKGHTTKKNKRPGRVWGYSPRSIKPRKRFFPTKGALRGNPPQKGGAEKS